MPIKLKNVVTGSPKFRIDAFRQTIPDEVGYTLDELAADPNVASSVTRVADIVRTNKWGVKQWDEETSRLRWVVVNPKTLAKYAKKTK